jgi:large subunit ribosomal protein L31
VRYVESYIGSGLQAVQFFMKRRVEMRAGIHPDYYQAKVVCNCGNEFVTGSTKEEIHVEICSKCHSFYTGTQKAAKARGRIEQFNKKYGVQ